MDQAKLPRLSPAQLSMFRFLVMLSWVFCLQAQAAKLTEIRSVEGITEYALNNGMQVLLFPDQSKDTITVNVTYNVGSKHENYGETGMAHLLEHLVFKGTPKHPNISKELTKYGARANGTTWLERTNYYETFKATDENLSWALGMEADRMVNSFIAQKDLDSEMTVVRNEFERGENNPSSILRHRVYASAYHWHNYGNSTIGARSDIENVKIENLQAFYKKYYQPDNATLIVAGKFDKEKTLKLIKKTFGKIKKPKRSLSTFYTRDPVQDGERTVVLRRTGGEQVVSAAYHIPSGLHEDFAAITVLAEILGDSPTGRLHKKLVEQQLSTRTFAWPNQQKEPSLLYFNASADLTTDIDKTEQVLLDTIESIGKAPITEKEVSRIKTKLLKDIDLLFNSSQNISIELSEWIGIGDWRMFFLNRDRIAKVSLDDVQRVAEHYLIRDNRTLGRFIPTDEPVRADIAEALSAEKILEGYVGREAIAQGEVFDPTPENIEGRIVRKSQGPIDLAILPIKTRGESVNLDIRLGYGDEKNLENKGALAGFTVDMLMKGTDKLNREEIQDQLDQLKASGSIYASKQGISGSFETTKQHVKALTTLIHQIITTANFPEKEFALLKQQKLAQLTLERTTPRDIALRGYSRSFNHYAKGHPFYASTVEEEIAQIESINLEHVRDFHRTYIGTTDVQVSLVGDVETSEITPLVFSLFDGSGAKKNYKRIVDTFKKTPKKSETFETPDKKNAIFLSGLRLNMTKSHPDAAALTIATHILGGGFLSSRLASRIREQDGLSYSVGASLRLEQSDTNGSFLAYAISAPGNTEKVHSAFKEEMVRAADAGFTEEELATAKAGFLDRRKVSFSSNKSLAQLLRRYLQEDIDMKNEQVFRDAIQNLSLDDVNRAMKTYLDHTQMNIIKAGDFAQGSGTAD